MEPAGGHEHTGALIRLFPGASPQARQAETGVEIRPHHSSLCRTLRTRVDACDGSPQGLFQMPPYCLRRALH
ncbi:hypothetical protein DPEC_G00116820 [Dallia pectoralis]|uniref:Uncharacterized protein n=1 Tax=Dallia pectoralis TaxID=75939 RepID=A0ACC2GV73_DALPE|nr:hypothetical protein DPEC_G00116820 [Dallia pectoralis]